MFISDGDTEPEIGLDKKQTWSAPFKEALTLRVMQMWAEIACCKD